MNASSPDHIRRIGIARLAEKAWPWLAQQDERDRRGAPSLPRSCSARRWLRWAWAG